MPFIHRAFFCLSTSIQAQAVKITQRDQNLAKFLPKSMLVDSFDYTQYPESTCVLKSSEGDLGEYPMDKLLALPGLPLLLRLHISCAFEFPMQYVPFLRPPHNRDKIRRIMISGFSYASICFSNLSIQLSLLIQNNSKWSDLNGVVPSVIQEMDT